MSAEQRSRALTFRDNNVVVITWAHLRVRSEIWVIIIIRYFVSTDAEARAIVAVDCKWSRRSRKCMNVGRAKP